jgi:transketolase
MTPAPGVAELAALARAIRRAALRMTSAAGTAHIGACFSCADILAVLYGAVLAVDPERPQAPARDRFVLSKGHAAAALYAALAARGFIPETELATYCRNGTRLAGHASHHVPGVELSTGSLGHGLPVATGMALAGAWDASPSRVFVLLSDGELDEGSNWEAALFAAHHGLERLTAIIDANGLQSLAPVAETLRLEPLAAKWESFGWEAVACDGHDLAALRDVLSSPPAGRPRAVIARTIKGKGVSFMEHRVLWHYRAARDAEFQAAWAELADPRR